MVDAALNIAAEQVIEHSAYGALLQRDGNRGPDRGTAEPLPHQRDRRVRPSPTAGSRLRWRPTSSGTGLSRRAWPTRMGAPSTRRPLRGATRTPRCASTSTWPRGARRERATRSSRPCGGTAFRSAKVMQPHRADRTDPTAARGFFEEVGHPVNPRTGTARCRSSCPADPTLSTCSPRRCSGSITMRAAVRAGPDATTRSPNWRPRASSAMRRHRTAQRSDNQSPWRSIRPTSS